MAKNATKSRREGDSETIPGDILRPTFDGQMKIEVRDLNVFYGKVQALFDVNVDIPAQRVTAFIGPSGSGKSSFLRVLNLTYDLASASHMTGTVLMDGEDLTGLHPNGTAITLLRRRVGMLFQRPNPFPCSIFENVAYGVRLTGTLPRGELYQVVEHCLQQVGLWNEVKDRLKQSALLLPLGEQQRLCLARALAVEPEVLLLDEPCAVLDLERAQMMEGLIGRLGLRSTVILATCHPRQAQLLAHTTGVFVSGRLIEYAPTHHLFEKAQDQRTTAFVTEHVR